MFIDIRELERDKLEFQERFAPGRINLGNDASLAETLETEGAAELIDSDIRLRGHLRTAVETACARCLEPAHQPVEKDFDLYYRPVQTIAREEEVEIDDAELEVGFYQGHGLLLEDALREQVLLDLPMKILCQPDCKGLCPQCGKDLNAGPCGCAPVTEARWQPLKALKDKLRS